MANANPLHAAITEQPLVSLILPVYNTGNHLRRCVASIQAQSYEKWEAILVDDGSTDDSGKLCDLLASEDSRIRVIHQKNAGLSAARNTGISRASGEFISFIDSDDLVLPDFIGALLQQFNKATIEIAVVGIVDRYGSQDRVNTSPLRETLSYEEFFKLTLLGRAPGSVCNRLYRRSALDKLSFRVGRYYEDSFFTIDGLGHFREVSVNLEPLYVYVHRESSITTQPFSFSSLDLIKAADLAHRICAQSYPQVREAATFRWISARFVVLDRLLQVHSPAENTIRAQLIKDLRAHTWAVIKMSGFHYTRKIAALALFFGWPLYKLLVQAKQRRTTLGEA